MFASHPKTVDLAWQFPSETDPDFRLLSDEPSPIVDDSDEEVPRELLALFPSERDLARDVPASRRLEHLLDAFPSERTMAPAQAPVMEPVSRPPTSAAPPVIKTVAQPATATRKVLSMRKWLARGAVALGAGACLVVASAHVRDLKSAPTITTPAVASVPAQKAPAAPPVQQTPPRPLDIRQAAVTVPASADLPRSASTTSSSRPMTPQPENHLPQIPPAQVPAPSSHAATANDVIALAPVSDVAALPSFGSATSRRVSAPIVAAPAPPPVKTTPAATPTVDPAPSAEEQNLASIRNVIDRYRKAYSTLDADVVQTFWPTVNTKALSRAFDQLNVQLFEFDSCSISTSGSVATAFCTGRATYAPRIGNRTPRVDSRRWTFHLEQSRGSWVIESVESR